MCGITAIFAYRSTAPAVDARELDLITDRMTARGPDARGTWISPDGRVGLGSRRLAIIDLSPDGTQPMHDASGELTIVFNGEIYNHRELRMRLERRGHVFRTTSDTEVLLAMFRQHGAEMVELLRGMFSFAIWNARTSKLFVARDPYGIKPLYLADDGATVRIASTVKALVAGGNVSTTRDPAALAGFFLLGSVQEPFTIYDSIRAIEPGTSFFVDERGVGETLRSESIAERWRRGEDCSGLASLVSSPVLMRELVSESLSYHLVSDVPVGVFLSAGIDSTTLARVASRLTAEPLRTVTLAFEELRGNPRDEAPLAERFARELGTLHTTRVVTRAEFTSDLPRFFEEMDQPTIDGANSWFVSKAASELGLKVALSGVGGDELFGGYPSFEDVPQLVKLMRLPLGKRIVGAVARTLSNPKSQGMALHGSTYAGAYLLKRGLFLPEELPAVMGEEAAREGLARLAFEQHAEAVLSTPRTPFGRVAALEGSIYLRNQLLRDTDWASMAHSVEVRTPLVDAWLLRQLAPVSLDPRADAKQAFAAAGELPSWLTSRPKTGFTVPHRQWLDLPDDGTPWRMRSWARLVLERYAR